MWNQLRRFARRQWVVLCYLGPAAEPVVIERCWTLWGASRALVTYRSINSRMNFTGLTRYCVQRDGV